MAEYRDLVKKGRERFKKELESILPDVKGAERLSGMRLNSEILQNMYIYIYVYIYVYLHCIISYCCTLLCNVFKKPCSCCITEIMPIKYLKVLFFFVFNE